MGLIRTLLIIGLIFFGVRILMRVILPMAMRFFFRRVQNKMTEQMKNQTNKNSTNEEFQKKGNVFVKPPPKPKTQKKPKQGEYVDFEDVE